MKRHRKGECAICGSFDVLTRDHVPPRCIFPPPRPHKLITVPTCKSCNHGSRIDDEQFKVAISMYVGADTLHASRLFDSTRETIRRNEVLRVGLLRSVRALTSPMGLVTGLSSVTMNSGPVYRTGKKIVAGLFYHHFERVLPATHQVSLQIGANIPDESRSELQSWIDDLAPHLERFSIGRNEEFRYGFCSANDMDHATVWILVFYDEMSMIGMTLPRAVDEEV